MSEPLGPHGSKFTPEITERFLDAVRYTGMTLKAACGAVGINPRTLERWLARARDEAEEAEGRGSPGPYTEFFLDVERAQGNALSTMELKQYQLALEGDGPSIRRWLETHDPMTWGRRGSAVPVAITGDNPQIVIQQGGGTSDNLDDYFGAELIETPLTIEAPE